MSRFNLVAQWEHTDDAPYYTIHLQCGANCESITISREQYLAAFGLMLVQ